MKICINFFINDFSCNQIGNVYNKNERTIQYIFKSIELELFLQIKKQVKLLGEMKLWQKKQKQML